MSVVVISWVPGQSYGLSVNVISLGPIPAIWIVSLVVISLGPIPAIWIECGGHQFGSHPCYMDCESGGH